MSLSCFRFKKRDTRYEYTTNSLTTDALANEKIGGTIIIQHLRENTADWNATVQTFVSRKNFNQPYQPDVFNKIFTSDGPQHDGAAIFSFFDGLICSVSTKLPMTKHNCEQCTDRGTRHASACSFSNFATVPIIVISEEKAQISLFWKGRAQLGIDKEDLKKELLYVYVTQEESCLAYATFDDQCFSKYFNMNALIPNDDDYKWYFEYFRMNVMDLHKGTTCKLGENDITASPENPEHYTMVEAWANSNARWYLESYNNSEKQCFILSHGDKRLGGFFYKVVDNAIVLGHPFLLRQLMHDGFAVRLFREVLWTRIHPQCNRIEFFVPPYLTGRFANMIKALNGKEKRSLLKKHKMCPELNVAFVGKLL